jgi:hypothetical protein
MAQQELRTPNALRDRSILTTNALQREVSFTIEETLVSVHNILQNLRLAKRLEHRREAKSLNLLLSNIFSTKIVHSQVKHALSAKLIFFNAKITQRRKGAKKPHFFELVLAHRYFSIQIGVSLRLCVFA